MINQNDILDNPSISFSFSWWWAFCQHVEDHLLYGFKTELITEMQKWNRDGSPCGKILTSAQLVQFTFLTVNYLEAKSWAVPHTSPDNQNSAYSWIVNLMGHTFVWIQVYTTQFSNLCKDTCGKSELYSQ